MKKYSYLWALLLAGLAGIANHATAKPTATISTESRDLAVLEIMQNRGAVVSAIANCFPLLEKKDSKEEYLKNAWMKQNSRYYNVVEPYLNKYHDEAIQKFGSNVAHVKMQFFAIPLIMAREEKFKHYFVNKGKKEGCINILKDIDSGKFDVKHSSNFADIQELTTFMESNP